MWTSIGSWIGNTVLDALFSLINALVNIFPRVNVESEYYTTIQTILNYIYQYDFIFPVTTLLTIVGLVIWFEMLYLVFKFFKWIIHKIATVA